MDVVDLVGGIIVLHYVIRLPIIRQWVLEPYY